MAMFTWDRIAALRLPSCKLRVLSQNWIDSKRIHGMKVGMKGSRETIQYPSGHSFRVLRWEKSLSDVECVLAPGKVERIAGVGTRWHFHVEMELTLFTSGNGTRFVGDHIGNFVAGDLVLLGEKLPHYWHTQGASRGISVQWHFPVTHPFWTFPENLALVEFFKSAGRGLRFSGETAAEISLLMQQLTKCQGVEQLATLLRLLARLANAPSGERQFLSLRSFALSAESDYQPAIAKAVRYLVANFREKINLDDLLKITRLSRSTFARQFKIHSGHSFSEFVNRLRAQATCRELRESDRAVMDIALNCGFTQVSFFNRLFRRLHGCSPTEYREQKQRAK